MGKEQLFAAVKKGDVAGVVAQLEAGIDVDSVDKFERTALHIAAHYNQPEIMEILISKGSNIDSIDEENWTPLVCALVENNSECAKILLQNKANPNIATELEGTTPLIIAAGEGNSELIDLLIDSGANINAIAKSGWTALHAAANNFAREGGDFANIKLLLENGAIVCKDNFFQKTPRDIIAVATDESVGEMFDQAVEEALLLGESNHGG